MRSGTKRAEVAASKQCLTITEHGERPAADFGDAPHAPRRHRRHDVDVLHDRQQIVQFLHHTVQLSA